ncbi:GAF domain-containing protein [Novosphingobium sp. RD2P27]|uniref:GAF domain-containing protein n=1 Tax=Novosphingobium kalidii TaxID=3230299 RepID=A0ABV2D5I2_9SPHN
MTLKQHVVISSEEPGINPGLPRLRLALVAEAAERLLAADDPARMVDELFGLIQSELRLDVFFNYRLANGCLILEAHGGLTDEQAAAGSQLHLGQAVCGCAARDRQRFHMTGVQASDDPLVAFVKDVGLNCYVCTPLVHGGTLVGTLGFGRKWADRFTDDELSFLHTLCHYVALAKYRLRVEQELRAGIAHRERLLSELNHRVRNALQLAVSVIRLEAGAEADQACAAAMRRAGDRIEVIASAHRPIYASGDLSTVCIAELLGDVGGNRAATSIKVTTTEGARLPIEQGVALALLVDTILSDARQIGKTAPMEIIVEGASGAITEVVLRGVAQSDDVLAQRLPRALLRQLEAMHSTEGEALIIRLPARPHA